MGILLIIVEVKRVQKAQVRMLQMLINITAVQEARKDRNNKTGILSDAFIIYFAWLKTIENHSLIHRSNGDFTSRIY